MAQSKRDIVRRSRTRGLWTEEQMKEALKEVELGTTSISKIGEKYGIPQASIRGWMSGKTSSKKQGPRTVLSKEEEAALVDWCLELQQNGHRITFGMLRRKVSDSCSGRQTPFKNGVPGKSWMDWFRKRHPAVVIESAQAVKGNYVANTHRAASVLSLEAEPTNASLIEPIEGMDERGGETPVKRDPFGSGGNELCRMESHNPPGMVQQLMEQEPRIDAQLPTASPMDVVNSLWKVQDHNEAGQESSKSDGSDSYPSSASNEARRSWTDLAEGIAGIERAIRESEDRKDRRLQRRLAAKDRRLQCELEAKDRRQERQLEANERIANGLIGALGQMLESLHTLESQGLGIGVPGKV